MAPLACKLALLLEEEDALEEEAALLSSEESTAGEVMASFLSLPHAERFSSGAANRGDFLRGMFLFEGVFFLVGCSADMARAKMDNMTWSCASSRMSSTSGKGKWAIYMSAPSAVPTACR